MIEPDPVICTYPQFRLPVWSSSDRHYYRRRGRRPVLREDDGCEAVPGR